MWKWSQFVKAGLLQSPSFSVVLHGGVGKHAARRRASKQVLNGECLNSGAEPAATNTGVRQEDIELPVDQVRIRGEAPRTPVEASHGATVG